jgi:(1->4)-alpha-D-glucan 1-alpha-D-glucosylmutase
MGIWPNSDSTGEGAFEHELPSLRERLLDFIRKATREAKMRTTWTEPDAQFERALDPFVAGMLAPSAPFLKDVSRLVARIAPAGFCNSLSRVLLNLSSPGIPDIYQGNELWNFALVDPDNRRPVDFALRTRVLGEMEQLDALRETDRATAVASLVRGAADGKIKFYLTRTLLRARRAKPEFWRQASYRPLSPVGSGSKHLICFSREYRGEVRLAIASRLAFTLAKGAPPTGEIWGDTRIPLPAEFGEVDRWTCGVAGHYVRVFRDAGGSVSRAADALSYAPVALLGPALAPSVASGAAIRDSNF